MYCQQGPLTVSADHLSAQLEERRRACLARLLCLACRALCQLPNTVSAARPQHDWMTNVEAESCMWRAASRELYGDDVGILCENPVTRVAQNGRTREEYSASVRVHSGSPKYAENATLTHTCSEQRNTPISEQPVPQRTVHLLPLLHWHLAGHSANR